MSLWHLKITSFIFFRVSPEFFILASQIICSEEFWNTRARKFKVSLRNTKWRSWFIFEMTDDVYAAHSREKELKKWRREKKVDLIETMNPTWKDLYKDLFEADSNCPTIDLSRSLPWVCRRGSRWQRGGPLVFWLRILIWTQKPEKNASS